MLSGMSMCCEFWFCLCCEWKQLEENRGSDRQSRSVQHDEEVTPKSGARWKAPGSNATLMGAQETENNSMTGAQNWDAIL